MIAAVCIAIYQLSENPIGVQRADVQADWLSHESELLVFHD